MSIHGVGTDILEIERIRRSFSPDSPFILRTYSEAERQLAAQRDNPILFYATRFSAKEAIFKALRTSSDGVNLAEIQVLENEHQAPVVALSGEMKRRAENLGITAIHISISYERECAIAFAVAEHAD